MSARVLLTLTDLPVYQNKMFATAEQARLCPRGDLRLVQDDKTGLVYNADFDPDLLSYDQSYQNEQGHSEAFRSHLDTVLDLMDRHFAGSRIMEVGCGKGAFLELLRLRGHDAIGIDPAYEGDAAYILQARFEPGTGIRADAIVMRHTLEHIADPLDFLRTVRDANEGSGLIYIEVPCLDWILTHKAWFDIFYEHVNYFRLGDFNRMFGNVIESGRLFGGQYLYVFADLGSLRDPGNAGLALEVSIPDDLFDGIDAAALQASAGARRIVWGGAAKGVMFAHHAQRRGVTLDFAIDINPAKQSMYLAGTGLQVLSPTLGLERLGAGDDVFVMNSNYLPEIANLGGDHLNYITVDQP
ncbi:MAG TPA: class I SAM-dependent methyltransferase [Luteimonas sp.]|nr:class I SAM-dependent methyltransferase [Luteimonas sp.]